MEIKNRVAIITGAASGIGRAVSFELARRSIKAIAMVDMSNDIDVAAEQVNNDAAAPVAVPFKGNVTDEDFRAGVFEQMERDYGRPTICVPAAGITRDALAVKINKETRAAHIYPIENFKLVLDINLTAPVYWAMQMIANIAEDRAKRGLKKWQADEGVQGTVVFIGSISSQGNKGQVSLCLDQGRPRRRGRHPDQRSDISWRALRCDPSGLYRHAHGQGNGRRVY